MNDKKRKKLVSVKIEEKVVEIVRQQKRETFMPIGTFFGLAAIEKIDKEKGKNKDK